MEVKNKTRNNLFKREEIELVLEAEKNPSFAETAKMLAEKFSKPEENVYVYNIKGNFGRNEFDVFAYIYDSLDDKKKAEQKTQKQRKAETEADKKQALKPESKQEQKPKSKQEQKLETAAK